MIRSKSDHPDASELNHACYKAGCAHFDCADYSRARAAFLEALEFWPEDWAAWMALGNTLDALSKPQSAEAAFRKALEFVPEAKADGVLFNLGNSLLDQGLYRQAIELYGRVPKGSQLWAKAEKNASLAEEKRCQNEARI